jgi:hypothetical protein
MSSPLRETSPNLGEAPLASVEGSLRFLGRNFDHPYFLIIRILDTPIVATH